VEQRDVWLNPVDASEAELKKRTLTNLYNQRPTWRTGSWMRRCWMGMAGRATSGMRRCWSGCWR
jgi:hypothetical protein